MFSTAVILASIPVTSLKTKIVRVLRYQALQRLQVQAVSLASNVPKVIRDVPTEDRIRSAPEVQWTKHLAEISQQQRKRSMGLTR